MSIISRLKSFVRVLANEANASDVEIDSGGGDIKTAQHFSAPGDDSFPVSTDYVLSSNVPRHGGEASHGYLDPLNAGVALEGGKRIYGRSKDGVTVNQVHLKNTGDILYSNDECSITQKVNGDIELINSAATFTVTAGGNISGVNGGGTFVLKPSGDFVVNGLIIMDVNGNITTPGTIIGSVVAANSSMTISGKELKEHTHPIAWTDSAGSGTSGPNN